jgi:hypothetical protein
MRDHSGSKQGSLSMNSSSQAYISANYAF